MTLRALDHFQVVEQRSWSKRRGALGKSLQDLALPYLDLPDPCPIPLKPSAIFRALLRISCHAEANSIDLGGMEAAMNAGSRATLAYRIFRPNCAYHGPLQIKPS